MGWRNDQEQTAQEKRYLEISNFLDNKYGFFSYFDIRAVVSSAVNNTLKDDFPDIPYSSSDIIEWAKWNDEESFFITPGQQAINAQENIENITEVVEEVKTSAQNTAIKLSLVGAALVFGFYYIRGKAKKFGSK